MLIQHLHGGLPVEATLRLFACSMAELDSECILTCLRSRCLRTIASKTRLTFQGLGAAARHARANGHITNNSAKKLIQLDESVSWIRHSNVVRAERFHCELLACFAKQGDDSVVHASSGDTGMTSMELEIAAQAANDIAAGMKKLKNAWLI